MCLCSDLAYLRSDTEIVLVRHLREAWLTSNTGRLAALMLSNVRVLPYGGGEPFDETQIHGDDTWLLFPDAKPVGPSERPRRLVVLDATFRQSRRMFRKIRGLHRLPRWTLDVPPLRTPGRRQPPRPDGLSTIEAITLALAHFESSEWATPLLAAYTEWVRRAHLTSGRRTDARSS
jgi:DTW domain-containing protein